MQTAKSVYKEVLKWLAIMMLAALIGTVSYVNQDTAYSKRESDRAHDSIAQQHSTDIDRVYRRLDQIQQNVDWLVLHEGGEPVRSHTEED